MKQNLNEQINRIKTIIALNESSIIKDTSVVELNEQWAQFVKTFVPALERKIITSLEGKLGKKMSQASDAEIATALKSSQLAVLRKEIAAAVYASEKTMIDDIFSKYDMSIPGQATAAYKELQTKGISKSINRDVALEFKANASKSSGAGGSQLNPNAILRPNTSPSPNKSNTNTLAADADEIITTTAKSSAEAAAYMAQVERLGFDANTTKILQLEYSKAGVANKSASELIELGNDLTRGINEKKYGWLKRSWANFLKDPSGNIKKGGKATIVLIVIVTLIKMAASGAAIADAIRVWVESKTGTSGSNILPSLPDRPSTGKKKYD